VFRKNRKLREEEQRVESRRRVMKGSVYKEQETQRRVAEA
jgi:hypothetical protein